MCVCVCVCVCAVCVCVCVCDFVHQFSGQCADEMRKTYAEFCSRHLKAVKLYKELLAKDKKFQYFIRVSLEATDF